MSDLLSGAAAVGTGGLSLLANPALNALNGGGVSYTGQNSGTPAMPGFLSNLNPDGSLKSNFSLSAQPAVPFQSIMPGENQNLGNIPQLNTNPLQQLESFANSGSSNPWVQAAQGALKQQQGQAMGAAKSNAAASTASAEDQAAARGGLGSGAIQNLATQGANAGTMAGQGVIGQGLGNEGQLFTQNMQNELGVLGNLPGQEVQALQPALQEQGLWQQAAEQNQAQQQQLGEEQQQYNTGVNQYNIGNEMGGLNAQNQFNLTNYANQIAQAAGNEQANAQANSGKK